MLSPSIKQRINSTYAQYNDNTVELEARVGHLTNRGFKPGVTREVFNRIKQYFDQRAGVVETKTTDYIGKINGQNVRKTVTVPTDNTTQPQTIWITKDRLWNQEDKNYGVRYSMSREVPIQPIPNFVHDVIREKNRYSYSVFNGMVRIDITIVNMVQDNGRKDGTKYEVEVELVNPRGLQQFDSALVVTLQKVLDTELLYTQTEANSIIHYVNMLLGSTGKEGVLDHHPLVQARNLKMKDMVWGGLIGNDKIIDNGTGYSVTHKADGQRKLLVFHDSGIWMVMAPFSLNKISKQAIPRLTGTILDGEYIPTPKRLQGAPGSKYWYLAFDCLMWSNHSVQNFPHGKRMNHAQAVADIFKTNLLYVNTKTFKNISTPQEFFKIMREMFREQEHLSYKNDGFMFTPSNTVYNPHSDRLPLYKRVLTDYPDICKWKPKEQLTIDFQIQWKATPLGSTIQLYTNEKGKSVLFKGTKIFPYENQVDHTHPLTQGLPNGTIVEYGWDYTNSIFVPHRIRFDKAKPNKIDIAEDVWMDIIRPLDKETMKGETFQLLRTYHNKIKKSLFNQAEGETLLDIGSGRGGDIAKWRKYSRIVAVEPNPEHIVELRRRLELNNMTDRVRIVNTGGEDIETIHREVRDFIGDRVDVVSMMLSMSFFWRSESMVNRLINTISVNIKPTGKFIFLTIDGDLVEQTFDPAFETGLPLTRLDLGPATLTYFPDTIPKSLHIHIEGTIVEDQTEWLVRLGDLVNPFRRFGFEFQVRERADKERFLTEEEITMTQMYTSGIFAMVPGLEKVQLPELENVVPGKETEPGLPTNPEDIPQLDAPLGQKGPTSPITALPPISGLPGSPVVALPPISGLSPVVGLPIAELSPIDQTDKIKKHEIKKCEDMELPNIPGINLPQPQVTQPETPVTPPMLPTVSGVLPTVPGAAPVPTTPAPLGQLPPIVVPGTLPGFGNLPAIDIETELSLIPMDTYQSVKVTWYPNEPVVRIGSIGDGSCFFHATIGGYYPPYQNNNNVSYRKDLVRKLRRDIAYTLQMEDPTHPGKTMYETAVNGQFTELYEQQLMGVDFTQIFDFPVDFSLDGLQRLFNSLDYLGNEVYQYASDILGVDIYVMRLTNKDLYVHQNTATKGVKRKAVVISGNGNHYETIGIVRDGLFQTTFDQNDPFILAIRNLITDEGGQ